MNDLNSTDSIKKVEKLYDDRITSSNDAVKAAGQWGSDEYVPFICEEIFKKIKIKKTDTVLELGCGSGVLGNYIKEKQQELADYNAGLTTEVDEEVNRRRLTNIGTFRAYAFNYLKNHPRIDQNMTLIVRQLSPGPEGIPLEIYCFTNTTEWAVYEDIQSDIFDHLLAIVPEFGLRLFQKPAGSDLENLK